MITAISLNNWKSFEDSELLIDQITFLIGTNASGIFYVDKADAYVNAESLDMRMRDNSWHNLFNTDPIPAGDMCGQITARFDKDRPGPRKGISLQTDRRI